MRSAIFSAAPGFSARRNRSSAASIESCAGADADAPAAMAAARSADAHLITCAIGRVFGLQPYFRLQTSDFLISLGQPLQHVAQRLVGVLQMIDGACRRGH